MATVHPSRLGLVRNAEVARPPPPTREKELKMRLMDRRNGQNGHSRDASVGRRNERSERVDDRGGRRDKEERRPRRSPSLDDQPRRRRSTSRENRPEREENPKASRRDRDEDDEERRNGHGRDNRNRPRDSLRQERDARDSPRRNGDDSAPRSRNDSRRASPSYRPYEGGPPPPTLPVTNTSYGYGPGRGDLGMPPPWPGPNGPNGGGGAPMRMGFDRQPRGGGGGWVNPNDLERRRAERDNMELSVWPPSPKEPFRDEDQLEADRKARRKSKKDKRRSKRKSRYSDESSSTDSEEERERRRWKRKEKERRRYDDDSDDEPRRRRRADSEEDRERPRRKPSVDSEEADRKRRKTRERSEEVDASQWVEKGGEASQKVASLSPTAQKALLRAYDEEDAEVGPHLPVEIKDRIGRTAYSHMLKGEGEAMAAFAASGQRIPRRGEIGLASDQIEAFEGSGYVMSGSRHQRMNAVRLRKENQVINAEEKRAILKLQREERSKKEGAIIGQFREMLDDRLVHVQNEQRDREKE